MQNEKPRFWSLAEVEEVIAAIKKEPGLWEELESVEQRNEDLHVVNAGSREVQIVIRLHRERKLTEITDLLGAIRRIRRTNLGLIT